MIEPSFSTVAIRHVRARVYRYPLTSPVRTSFGIMHDRPMLVVEVEDAKGTRGFGEVWCNFPAVGAEHRARIIDSVLAPILTSRNFANAPEAFSHLTAATEILALQAAEPGPIAQSIAGIDIALWDLAARNAGLPLYRFINPEASPEIGVYASGINPDAPEKLVAAKRAAGFTAFKLKVGFGLDRDLANLRAVRDVTGPSLRLMCDANQGWTFDQALASVDALAPFDLTWLEEPLRCDRPWTEWQALAKRSPIPLAAGENLAGIDAFREALDSGVLHTLQPDMAKWGGFSGCLPVARAIRAAGKTYCPHYLGGGIGLLASAHLLAAAGGGGLLEIDANPNPLRTLLCGPLAEIAQGRATLGEHPGLGPPPDLAQLNDYLIAH